jgi:hypothetical protein
MKKVISQFTWIPEFYFILASVLWFYNSLNGQHPENATLINFPAVVLIVLFHIQLFLKDHSLGKFLAYTTTIVTLYFAIKMFFVRPSILDFSMDSNIALLKFGNVILLNFIMAFWMYRNYNSNKNLKLREIEVN